MSICACGRRTNHGQSICDRCTALLLFGLTRDAAQNEIKDAYRVLAKVWHPDRFQSDERLRQQAEEKLKEINSAYHLLTTAPAEEPQRRTAGSPPKEPPQTRPESSEHSSAQWSPPRPITNHFANAFRTKRRAARIRIALTVLVLVVAAAWLLDRYGRTLAYELNIPIKTVASASHPTTHAPESSPNRSAGTPANSNNSSAKSTRSRNATVAGSPSLLVYPDDDPRVAYFTVGSTTSDVVKVQGVPTKIAGNIFEYGSSQVYFQNGRVESWRVDPGSPLKARVPE